MMPENPVGEAEKALAVEFLSMDPQDALLKYLGTAKIIGGQTHIEFSQINSRAWGGLSTVTILSASGQDKTTLSGDKLIIRSHSAEMRYGGHSNKIVVACWDGQTPVSPLAPEIKHAAESFLKPGQGRDSIVPNIVASKAPQLMDSSYESPYCLEELPTDLLHVVSNYYGFDSSVSDVFRIWHDCNILTTLALGSQKYEHIEAEGLPGMTGTIMQFNSASSRLEFCSLADSPVILVYIGPENTGLIKMENINSNLPSDRRTVWEMNELIKSGKATDAIKAREMLLENGYFARSYRHKSNHRVPICNGQLDFHYFISKRPLSYESGFNLAAAVFCSDGLLYFLNSLSQGEKVKQFLQVMKMLLNSDRRGAVLDYIKVQEVKTWNIKKPTRERLSDDQQVVVMTFLADKDLQNLDLMMNF